MLTWREAYRDPLQTFDWGALSQDDYWLPPERLSLHGAVGFDALPEKQRKRLSHLEFLNFIDTGLWLEAIFIERLGSQLKRTPDPASYARLLQEIREEAGHSLMFLRLMEETGLRLPQAGRTHSLLDFLGHRAPTSSALFWLAVVVGEEIPDQLNHAICQARAVNVTIWEMAALHMRDEAHHISHARHVLANKLASVGNLQKRFLGRLAGVLIRYLLDRCYLPSPQIYELAGLGSGEAWRERARNNPHRLEWVAHCVGPTIGFLEQHGVIVKAYSTGA
ncbi:MAG: diiron oxygenase [Sulfuricellaceae bacterium]|nr:diiron oxygenase [Sulfuricellaceae bacterium]